MTLSGKSVVVIGDSHTDLYPFGTRLEAGLKEQGASVTVLAIGGSAASNWLGKRPVCRTVNGQKKCQSLGDVAGRKFDLAIITLGTNDAANANRASEEGGGSRAALAKTAAQQLQKVGEKLSSRVVWVGPPPVTGRVRWYTQDAMDELYRAALPLFGSSAIDSRQILPPGFSTDGVHPQGASSRYWADQVLERVAMMEMPAVEKAGAGAGVAVVAVVLAAAFFWVRNRRS